MDPVLEQQLRAIYASTKTIAVVGATPNPDKPGNYIPAYLQSQGYRIVPVTPTHGRVLGERAYGRLSDVDVSVDVVQVFRPPGEAPDIVRGAIDLDADVVWMQPGIVSEEAAELGRAAGLTIVMDRCMGATHGELGLGPGP